MTAVGPFLVDREGTLHPRHPDRPPSFDVRWRGRVVRARVALSTVAEGGGALGLAVVLGRIPSTLGPDTTAARERLRERLLGTVRDLPSALPPGWRVTLRPDHGIGLRTDANLPSLASTSTLLTTLTGFLLDLEPYLDLLDQDGAGMEAV